MRTLPADLLAAQKKATAIPYVRVQIQGRIGDVTRLAWECLYTGSEADRQHAAVMPGDASLVRARVDAAGVLLVQRVANPGPGSTFSSWTSLCTIPTTAPIALTASGASVLLFYVDTGGTAIKLRASSDYGQSFGSPSAVVTASGTVGFLAATMKSDGTVVVIYSVGAAVYRVKRSGGTWGTARAWTNSVAGVTGLVCYYSIDFNVIITGSDSASAAKVWTAILGDGFNQPVDTWSLLMELTRADSGSNVTFKAPFIDRPDLFRLSFVEKYSGSQAYARPLWSHVSRFGDFATNTWREPVPFNVSRDYGLAMTHGGGYAWLSTAAGVWRASTASSVLDVTEDVLELREDITPFDGRIRITLRNDDGRYSDLTTGSLSLIALSSQVDLSLGYVTELGERVSAGPRYWIEGWEYDCRPGASTFVLLARDGWWHLRHWRARREYAWATGEKSVFQIFSFLLSRAGMECGSFHGSNALTSLKPSFAIHPGEDGLTAVQRLLQLVPDVVRMAGETATIMNPTPNETPSYAYGIDHVLLEGRYEVADRQVNRAVVFGKALVVESFDWFSIANTYDRLLQVDDLNLTAVGDAQARADAVLRKSSIASLDGEVLVPVNCGQELYDVVALTDGRAGLNAALRRVIGMSVQYSRGKKPSYQMRLRLGTV